jgi:LacI family transcriptional regulator
MKRVTVREVARKAKVHFTLVAMALRDDPRVRASTKERILKVAARLGYQRDAKLTELMTQIKTGSTKATQEKLAFISTTHDDFATSYVTRCMYEGVRNRATSLGYDLETFFVEDFKNNYSRLSTVLYARGVKGVLFQPMHASPELESFAWDHFACVALGAPLPGIPMHTARHHHFHAMLLAHEKILKAGIERIGFFIWEEGAAWTNHEFEAAYAYAQQQLPVKSRVPLLKVSAWPPPDPESTNAQLLKWIQRHNLQATISVCSLQDNLRQLGFRLPRDISHVELGYNPVMGDVAGIEQKNDISGMFGVDMIVGQIHRKETGIPTEPKIVLNQGSWRTGGTLQSKKR